ncbi:methyltransferase domain-containing protein [candidate division KSB1 bacterium]|nr:methyltransferase domain-containing protein [candidate division KSB1 bacterium]
MTPFLTKHGIPQLLKPERAPSIREYCAKYDRLRLQEGWASTDPEFYLQLPFHDRTGRHVSQWQLRAQSFRQLQKWIEKTHGLQRLRILDAGAGSGWMSRLLAETHHVLATDVNGGAHGLNAHVQRRFLAVQAELDCLPLAANSFDLIIANASAHYANDVQQFFAEAARVLRPGGRLVVMDSPVYRDQAAVAAAHERTRDYYARNRVPELAQNYGGLARELFIKPSAFDFTCLRRDFDNFSPIKKWLREKLGKASAARFPIWIGARLPVPNEDWHFGRPRAGALLVRDNKLLTYFFNGNKQQYWRIPGGGIEEGESPEHAAVRELREELGLEITLRHRFGPYLFANKEHYYFLAETNSADLPQENASGFEESCTVNWLPLARLAEFELYSSALQWELVEYFQKNSRA